jgi:hypothetical protein
MKLLGLLSNLSVSLLLCSRAPLCAQSSAPSDGGGSDLVAIARDEISTTKQRTNWVVDATGKPQPEVHNIIEMATGKNYVDDSDGTWKESQDKSLLKMVAPPQLMDR